MNTLDIKKSLSTYFLNDLPDFFFCKLKFVTLFDNDLQKMQIKIAKYVKL